MWFFFFKQKTAYEMRISDWSSDVCSSDLALRAISAVQECPNHRVHRCDLARLGRTTGDDRPNGFIRDRELDPRRINRQRIGQLPKYIIGSANAFCARFADAQHRWAAAGRNTAPHGPELASTPTAKPAPATRPTSHH